MSIRDSVLFLCAAVLVSAAPPGQNGPTEAQPAKMQMHVGVHPVQAPAIHHNPPPNPNNGNPAVQNVQNHHEQGPVPAAATNYESYSSNYGGGGSNYGAQEYSNDNYGFECYGKKPALYGDATYDCRLYHVCQADGRSDTIKCPKFTRFNNYLGICDWHFKVDNYCNPLPDYKGDGYGAGYSQGGSGGYQQGGGGY